MVISETQLETWGKHTQYDTAVRAHEEIREAILESSIRLASRSPDIFLQGSYKNYTNITTDSDVDVVVMSTMDWMANTDRLTPYQEMVYHSDYASSTYPLMQIRSDVISALEGYFSFSVVDPRNKAIRVEGKSGIRRAADVVVANEYRVYNSYSSGNRADYTSGIYFTPADGGDPIINYPKQHFENGKAKQNSTSDWFKRTVRIFKNARNYLVDNGEIDIDMASSYFIQCLLYNVPNHRYGGSHRLNFDNVLQWLIEQHGKMADFICQNGITKLFGYSDQQWNDTDVLLFAAALRRLNS